MMRRWMIQAHDFLSPACNHWCNQQPSWHNVRITGLAADQQQAFPVRSHHGS
ncbi:MULTISPECIES: hypothetical protein [unclassified Azospirillum]|jgi:hypothetical protein|uniref:hypothetical protein n=1 Tax=unclassified Azospirillum TaxID=2630922 RepID=UPI001359C7BB|nr:MULTISPECIES: hypothetical protein [unclassified Azospirillum]